MSLRFLSLIVITILLATLNHIKPDALEIVAYKMCLVSLSGLIGYWIDKALFPYADPDEFRKEAEEQDDEEIKIALMDSMDTSAMRRAVIISAVVIGTCLGL